MNKTRNRRKMFITRANATIDWAAAQYLLEHLLLGSTCFYDYGLWFHQCLTHLYRQSVPNEQLGSTTPPSVSLPFWSHLFSGLFLIMQPCKPVPTSHSLLSPPPWIKKQVERCANVIISNSFVFPLFFILDTVSAVTMHVRLGHIWQFLPLSFKISANW